MKVPTSFARPFVLLLMPLMLWASQAQAVIEIDISDPNIQPLPIAVTDFTGGSAQAGDLGAQISAVIAADL
jgi:TolB protein